MGAGARTTEHRGQEYLKKTGIINKGIQEYRTGLRMRGDNWYDRYAPLAVVVSSIALMRVASKQAPSPWELRCAWTAWGASSMLLWSNVEA